MKNKYIKKVLSGLLIAAMLLCNANIVLAESDDDISIIYTQDVHCAYLDYDKVATLAKNADLLIDGGDAIEGDLIGVLSKGQYVIDIMNHIGYDAVAVGNHEFDFTVPYLESLDDGASFEYLCCNCIDLATGELVLKPYEIFEVKGKKIAIVSVVSPETLSKSKPIYFKDADGKQIYGFCEGNNGKDLYKTVQKYVDEAKAKSDVVILVGHLGIAEEASPWTAPEVIANISGVDLLLDGHSHNVYETFYTDKTGKKIPAIQTGTHLENVAKIVISADNKVSAKNIPLADVPRDSETTKYLETITANFKELQNKIVGTSKVNLCTTYNGNRAVRYSETNIGDFSADAYRFTMGADIAFVNGGCIRADINAGPVTYGNTVNVHPYKNYACLVEVSGQQIKDALEFGTKAFPAESGGFLQVSGLTYTLDATKPSHVVTADDGSFVKVDGEYRVKDIKVGGEDLDLNKKYTLASHDYMLKMQGDGYSMFGKDSIKMLKDEEYLDNEVLIEYITHHLNGVIGEEYAKPQGRINIITIPESCSKNLQCMAARFTDVELDAWYHDSLHYVLQNGLMNGMGGSKFAPKESVSRAMAATVIYRLAESLGKGFKGAWMFPLDYADASEIAEWAYKAVAWCKVNGIMIGNDQNKFCPDDAITREELAVAMQRFAKFMGIDTDAVQADINTLPHSTLTRAELAAVLMGVKL